MTDGIIYEDQLIRKPLDFNLRSPVVVVHPYCFCEWFMYDGERREKLRKNVSYNGYLQNMEDLIRNSKGELFFFERGTIVQHLNDVIRDFGRKSNYSVFAGDEEYLSLRFEDDFERLRKLEVFKDGILNVAGGNLDQHLDIDGSRQEISFYGCLGAAVERLIEGGFKINIPPGLTFDHKFSMNFEIFEGGNELT